MTSDDLIAFREGVTGRHLDLIQVLGDINPAPEDVESTEIVIDAYVEALFLRAFTAYENDLETLFLHYVTGGLTLAGVASHTYLRANEEAHARRITRGANKFLSWAQPQKTRTTADNYLRDG
ncbi:MAG TPA: hypothetical protein VK325_11430 [Pseudoxanthomonas sp.]|nr:hypothetical protein [Pseudoxanthomonas sp.]